MIIFHQMTEFIPFESSFFHRTPLVAASVHHIVRVINVEKSNIPAELTFKRTEEGC